MYYCKNCGREFEKAEKSYETHRLADTPFEVFYVCPFCKSQNFHEKNLTHCRCCGSRLPKGQTEYCCDSCKNKGEKMWQREVKKRRNTLKSPLQMVVKECAEYNKVHGTKYSYGQYVALIRPKLKREKHQCGQKKRNI